MKLRINKWPLINSLRNTSYILLSIELLMMSGSVYVNIRTIFFNVRGTIFVKFRKNKGFKSYVFLLLSNHIGDMYLPETKHTVLQFNTIFSKFENTKFKFMVIYFYPSFFFFLLK